MKKIHDKKVNDIIHNIGLNNNLKDSEVKDIIESQFRFTYETIKNMNIDDLSDEEIDKLKTNFFYKYLGKVYTNSNVVNNYKLKIEIREKNGRIKKLNANRSSGD